MVDAAEHWCYSAFLPVMEAGSAAASLVLRSSSFCFRGSTAWI